MRLLSSDEMKQVEQYTAKYGLSYQRMMENAGAACARNIRNIVENENMSRRNAVIVCGKGNNGGDGFVVARKLGENGYNVCVILACGYPDSPESTYMYKLVIDSSIPTVWYDADRLKAMQTIKNADIVVDAIFGFSFYGSISEDLKLLIKEMNNANGLKFAIDVPSGVYCDSGYHDPGCFNADYTIAISALKPAHIIHPATDFCGDIIIANIGIPEDSYNLVKDSLYTYNKTEVGHLFPSRKTDAHKGTFGHLLCICGSKCMAGAPVLCASAALRSGAGLVTVAFPESAYIPIATKLTEALLMPLKENSEGTLSAECLDKLLPNLDKFDGIVIGPGLGVNEDTAAVVKAVLENAKVPVIVDADGINIIAKDISILRNAKSKVVLTPHPKEMSRLAGIPTEIIQSDRIGHARKFSEENKVYLVLKGSNTVVSEPDSKRTYVNASGNNGLSKGGSGDVLTGIIGGFTVQDFGLVEAITAAVYIHGHVADVVADNLSKSGMLPSDVVSELAATLGAFEK